MKIITIVAALVISAPIPAQAQDLAKTAQAFNLIADFANKMCTEIPIESQKRSVKLNGNGKAQLDSLLSKIANIGINGSVSVEDTHTKGVLQDQLAGAVKDDNTCRAKIFESVKDSVLPKKAADLDPDSIRQLASAHSYCDNSDFVSANAILSDIDNKFPGNTQVQSAKGYCSTLDHSTRAITVSISRVPGVFKNGKSDRPFQASLSVDIDGDYCGRASNIRDRVADRCSIKPGTHRYQLSDMDVYDLNGTNEFVGGTCAGQMTANPIENDYSIIICLKKPYVTCNVLTKSVASTFSYDKCRYPKA